MFHRRTPARCQASANSLQLLFQPLEQRKELVCSIVVWPDGNVDELRDGRGQGPFEGFQTVVENLSNVTVTDHSLHDGKYDVDV